MNIANKITLFRICLIPVFFLVFFSSLQHRTALALCIIVIAGLSDVLDGYIARKYDMITSLGTVLDPLADKGMMLSVVGSMAYVGWMPSWLFLFFLLKEGIQILLGTFFYFNKYNIRIPANHFGKAGTAFLYLYILSVGLPWIKPLENILLFFVCIFALAAFLSYGKALKDTLKGR